MVDINTLCDITVHLIAGVLKKVTINLNPTRKKFCLFFLYIEAIDKFSLTPARGFNLPHVPSLLVQSCNGNSDA